MENKLEWSKFQDKFHPSWHRFMKDIIESPEMWDIMQFHKHESRRGIKITPLSEDLFKSFSVDLDKLQVVMMGQDVYPQVFNGIPAANGYAFDCRNYGKISPSLDKLWKAMSDDIGVEEYEESKSLQHLIDQNVMLTNAALSCEKDKSGKYVDLWKPFWEKVFNQIFSLQNGLIFLLMGEKAQYYEKYTLPFAHYVLKCEHPVKASYQSRDMIHENVFSKCNSILRNNNGQEFEINWLNNPFFARKIELLKELKEQSSEKPIIEDDLPW